VEQALKAMARKLHAARQADPNATAAQLDPDSAEVQQLKSAAMPLLFQLRDEQKEEVRKLARIIGLDKVAAAI
jgi:ABC-type transporter Mla MlaB component